jgi:hypothetical protein
MNDPNLRARMESAAHEAKIYANNPHLRPKRTLRGQLIFLAILLVLVVVVITVLLNMTPTETPVE